MRFVIMRDRPKVLEFRNTLSEAEAFAETIKPANNQGLPSARVYIYQEVKVYE